MNHVEIAVDRPTGPNRTFTYNVPEGMGVSVGQLVRVSFSNRTSLGIVFHSSQTATRDSVLDILEVISEEAILTENQLVLANWVSQYYHASLYKVALAMLPPGMIPRRNKTLVVDNAFDRNDLTQDSLNIIDYITSHPKVSRQELIEEFGRIGRALISELMARNIVAWARDVLPPRVAPKMQEFLTINPEHDYRQMLLDVNRAAKQRQALETLHEAGTPVPASLLRGKFGASPIRALVIKGFLAVHEIRSYRSPSIALDYSVDSNRVLSNDQVNALRGVQKALNRYPESKKMLLWGIAGSGKTEVYLRAVEECLSQGRTAMILVPDISLATQTVSEVIARFPGQVAVLHSGLSPGEQFDQWQQLLTGAFRIVVGVRSAVFAPIENLGLIVVDEEHDWNYKQSDREPRYHARDVASKLAELSGAVLLLGSATPDVESYYAAQNDRYALLQMHRRPEGRINPPVRTTVVDMRGELREGNRSVLSRALIDKLTACLDQGNKAILFINRRGAAQSVQCRSCGYIAQCSRCEITLTYHGETNQLNCHYCGRIQSSPDQCPLCADNRIRYLGLGTQRVVQELQLQFPDIEIIRYDSDVARKAKEHQAIIARFRVSGSKIMVGTQMLAKGLDFPDVGLVGIVLADLELTKPNFRASERSFQLLAQVAGRAGRRTQTADVIIQTYSPDHYVVKSLAKLEYAAFASQELAYRHRLRQPPFEKHVRLICQHFKLDTARDIAEGIFNDLMNIDNAIGIETDVLGPVLAYPPKLNGKYRWQVLLRGNNPMETLRHIHLPHDLVVDVDPIEVN